MKSATPTTTGRTSRASSTSRLIHVDSAASLLQSTTTASVTDSDSTSTGHSPVNGVGLARMSNGIKASASRSSSRSSPEVPMSMTSISPALTQPVSSPLHTSYNPAHAGYRYRPIMDPQTQTMIDNLPTRTGRSLEQWYAVLDNAGPLTHGRALTLLKSEHGVSHGYANAIVTLHRARDAGPVSDEELIGAQYAGGKAPLRPVCDHLIAAALALGDDVEVAPKKTGVSLRRSKQFALIEVPSARRVRLGLNLRGEAATDRLREQRGMCTHSVDLAAIDDLDGELIGWLRSAYERA